MRALSTRLTVLYAASLLGCGAVLLAVGVGGFVRQTRRRD